MAYTPRSSLIPTETSGAIPVRMKKKRTVHAFGLIATLIFIFSLLAAVGVFLYKDYLTEELRVAREGLAEMGNEEIVSRMNEIKMYDDKLRIAQNLLDNHIAPSLIFRELEDSTKVTVQFSSFEFVHDPGFEAVLTLQGNTPGFDSVALQKMQILEDSIFSNFVLQDIAMEGDAEGEDGSVSEGGISFRVTGVFRPDIIEYDGTSAPLDTRPSGVPVTSPAPSTAAGSEAADDNAPIVIPAPI